LQNPKAVLTPEGSVYQRFRACCRWLLFYQQSHKQQPKWWKPICFVTLYKMADQQTTKPNYLTAILDAEIIIMQQPQIQTYLKQLK